MFEIKARIVDDFEELRNISLTQFDEERGDINGLFALNFNGNWLNDYHEDNLDNVHSGWDWLILWFDLLFEVQHVLKTKPYALLKVIETYDSWIEFVDEKDYLKVSFARCSVNEGSAILTSPPIGIRYEVKNIYILKKDVKKELIRATEKFIKDVEKINPSLKRSKGILSLLERLGSLSS